MYLKGEGVLEDLEEAYAWFLLSSMNGIKDGVKLKNLLQDGLTTTQQAAGLKRAKEILKIIEQNAAKKK